MVFVTGIARLCCPADDSVVPSFLGLFVVVNKFVNALGALGDGFAGMFSQVVTGRGLLYGGVAGFFASLSILFSCAAGAQYYLAASTCWRLSCVAISQVQS